VRRTAAAILILAALAAAAPGRPRPQEPDKAAETVTADVSMVLVNVTVLTGYGFPVAGLKAENFKVFDNGTEMPVAVFQETAQRLNIVMIIDSSGSTYKQMSLIKQGAVDFIRRIQDTRAQDRMAIVHFNDDISLLADFETGWREKAALVQDRLDAMGGTALYDAILLTTRDVIQRTPGRRIVVLYTDGIDNKSLKDFNDAFGAALASDATFFILTVDNMKQALEDANRDVYQLSRRQYYEHVQGEAASRSGRVEPQWTRSMHQQYPAAAVLETSYRLAHQRLARLAETSGGKFFKVASYEELPGIYRTIAAELPYTYTLGYQPDLATFKPGEFRSIEVRVDDPALRPRYRRGYYYTAIPAAAEPPKP
jgi:VWFA-related protein